MVGFGLFIEELNGIDLKNKHYIKLVYFFCQLPESVILEYKPVFSTSPSASLETGGPEKGGGIHEQGNGIFKLVKSRQLILYCFLYSG